MQHTHEQNSGKIVHETFTYRSTLSGQILHGKYGRSPCLLDVTSKVASYCPSSYEYKRRVTFSLAHDMYSPWSMAVPWYVTTLLWQKSRMNRSSQSCLFLTYPFLLGFDPAHMFNITALVVNLRLFKVQPSWTTIKLNIRHHQTTSLNNRQPEHSLINHQANHFRNRQPTLIIMNLTISNH